MPFFPNGCRALLVQRAERARQGESAEARR